MEKKKEGAHTTTIPRTHVHISSLFPISRRRERDYFPLCRRSLRERVRPSFRRYDFLPLLPPPPPCVDLSVACGPRRGGGGGRRRRRGRGGATCYLRIVPRGREGEEGEKPSELLFPPPFPPSPSRYVVRGGSVSLIFLFPPLSTPVPCISLASFLTPLLCRYRKIQCYSFFFPQVISVHFAFWLVTTQNSPF